MNEAAEFLEFGGSVTLNFISSGSDVLRNAGGAFVDWCVAARAIAKSGNAVLIAFLRSTPRFFAAFSKRKVSASAVNPSGACSSFTARIAETDAERVLLPPFKSSAEALTKVSIKQFDEWVKQRPRRVHEKDTTQGPPQSTSPSRLASRIRRASKSSYRPPARDVYSTFSVSTSRPSPARRSRSRRSRPCRRSRGSATERRSICRRPSRNLSDDEMDFRLYKVLAAHGAGQIEFGTFDRTQRS